VALQAIITAGGRLPPELHEHSSSRVKALLKLHERTLLDYSVSALQEAGIFERMVVVGNDEVSAATPAGFEYVEERDSLVGNIQAGFEFLGGRTHDYLLFSPDLPFVSAEAVRHFAATAARECDLGFAYVTRDDFLAHFPGSPNRFEKVNGMEMTLGSCVYMSGTMLGTNIPLVHDFYRMRRSPFKLAMLLGFPVTWSFITGKLRLDLLEQRFAQLTGGRVKALRVEHAGIAYDIDSLANYMHALEVLQQRALESSQ
jgi:CTP:molybdopterin cytidylyltransferase MocA